MIDLSDPTFLRNDVHSPSFCPLALRITFWMLQSPLQNWIFTSDFKVLESRFLHFLFQVVPSIFDFSSSYSLSLDLEEQYELLLLGGRFFIVVTKHFNKLVSKLNPSIVGSGVDKFLECLPFGAVTN